MANAEYLVEQYAGQQGWNDGTVINLLCRFIDDLGETLGTDSLEHFLGEIADEENADTFDLEE